MSKYDSSITLAENIQKVVASHIQAAKKSWNVPGASSDYYQEKKDLVQAVTDAVMQNLETRHETPVNVLQLVGQDIIDGIDTVIHVEKKQLQAILDQEKSKGNSEHVIAQFRDQDLSDHITEAVWGNCKDAIAKEDLRLAMVEQMKKDIAPVGGVVYGEYTDDRDRLVNYVVDQAMKKLPADLSAEVIFKNRVRILGLCHQGILLL